MDEENAVETLQRFRRDRRVLLDFILSGSLIKKVIMPPGAISLDDVDLDQVSVDYVLTCAKRGDMLELSEAIRQYHDSTLFPSMKNTGSADEFFLVTYPESSGSPPRRAPPPIPVISTPIISNHSKSQSLSSAPTHARELSVDDIDDFEDDDDLEEVDNIQNSRRNPKDASDLLLGLPPFATGISDDDLRETAYEILLASAGASGGLIVPAKDKKKDKKSKLMRKLGRSKSESVTAQSERVPGMVGLLETMRVQMEISEAMDIRTRQALLNALVGKVGKRMDTLLIPLELLCCISRTEFSDKKAYIRWQKRQLKILEEGLINQPVMGYGESGRKASDLRILFAKIEESEFRPTSGEVQRMECLKALKDIAIPLAERPARGDLTGEVCHWADGYHLNVKIYEKLLLSVFDVLDEGKLTEEVEEILELLKSTWRILGITETIHYTCYAWVLFRQFVITGEQELLQHAIEQLRQIPLKEQRGPKERSLLKSLHCRYDGDHGLRDSSFLWSFLSPIHKWADKRLSDYHLHFAKCPETMEKIVNASILVQRLLAEEPEIATTAVSDQEQIELYVSSSIKSAFTRIVQSVEKSDSRHVHTLALLANEINELLKKDVSMFMPILSKWFMHATVISSSLVHKLYGNKLKPFLGGADHLTEDVVAVFSAAVNLEQYVVACIMSVCEAETADAYCRGLNMYDIETISGTLVMRWVNSQLGRVMNWVERAIQQERWDPISPQQRHGNSIVEVYRIVEETIDQFFALEVPMRGEQLSCLVRGIDNAFHVYVDHIVNNLASAEDLIPPVPILTRYSKEGGIKAFVKKELIDQRLPDAWKSSDINVTTTPKLCVQLNTLYYAVSQLSKLEDGIWERWKVERPLDKRFVNGRQRTITVKETFDGGRKDINAAIDKICEFAGIKIIFWDLREPFIDNLYKPTVALSRLESIIEPLDMELNQLCDVIVEALRDRVVTGLLQASLEGLLRVLLDGGSSRVFSVADAKLLEEDLEVLKEFFISGGDGLPRGVVENQVARVRGVVKLLGYETRVLIEDLRTAIGLEMQGDKSKLGTDTKTLLRVLCHRNDSEASQFLKKQFKIPRSSA
uniref:Protein unc-13 homolog n=1 Tax=Kalanchoe fedtschenkoi TaxID=63787 RepID=A0A7N0ZYM5_KALFE